MSKKSPPTVLAGRVSPCTSMPGARNVPCGSIARWMSRATFRSCLSDRRSATSSTISRLSSTKPMQRKMTLSFQAGIGRPSSTSFTFSSVMKWKPANSLIRPMMVAISATT